MNHTPHSNVTHFTDIGVLTSTPTLSTDTCPMRLRDHPAITQAIFLKMTYKREDYMGFLACGDLAFCCQLDTLLQRYVGWSIKDVGDLDLSFTL